MPKKKTYKKLEDTTNDVSLIQDWQSSIPSKDLMLNNLLAYQKLTKSPIYTAYSKKDEVRLLTIGLASANRIRQWAEKTLPNGNVVGEVTKADTLNHKTFKPVKGGLFCERIFGPVKDFQCACSGSKKQIKKIKKGLALASVEVDATSRPTEGSEIGVAKTGMSLGKQRQRFFCPQCDVEYTWSVIRRYQLGFIKLNAPVTHVWYLKGNPSYISLLLDMKKKHVESIVYCTETLTLENSLCKSFSDFPNYMQEWPLDNLSAFPTKVSQDFNDNGNVASTSGKNNVMYSSVILEGRKATHLEKQAIAQYKYLASSLKNNIKAESFNIKNNKPSLLNKVNLKAYYLYFRSKKTIPSNQTPFAFEKVDLKKSLKTNIKFISSRLGGLSADPLLLPQEQNLKYNFDKSIAFKCGYVIADYELARSTGSLYTKLNSMQGYAINFEFVIKLLCLRKNKHKNEPEQYLKHEKTSFGLLNKSEIKPLSARNLNFLAILVKKATPENEKKNQSQSLRVNSAGVNVCKISIFLMKTLLINRLVFFLTNLCNKNQNLVLCYKNLADTKNPLGLLTIPRVVRPTELGTEIKTKAPSPIKKANFSQIESSLPGKIASNYSGRIVNNIYCLSHRLLWENEKDWQFFALYYFHALKPKGAASTPSQGELFAGLADSSNGRKGSRTYSGIKIQDQVIPTYEYRYYDFSLLNTFFSASNHSSLVTNAVLIQEKDKKIYNQDQSHVSYSGAGIIKTLLAEFDYFELKKMDKQNRILLYDLNKYIRKIRLSLSISTIGNSSMQKDAPWGRVGRAGKEQPLTTKEVKTAGRYFKELCQQRDALIRRTKLIRKIYRNYAPATIPNHENMPNEEKLTVGLRELGLSSPPGQDKGSIGPGAGLTSMILTLLPVLPPDLRPIVKMGTQIAASDLNRLYQRVIYRNDRLKRFLKDPATNGSYEMKYAQRLLQEAVDNLIQNGKSGVVAEKDARGRALKSLSDILKGKQGRFRQYLLGKRVDYSGRSVIVVGPTLKLHECGIPKEMALELYLPFLIKRILNQHLAATVIGAKALIASNKPLAWSLLREILKTCPVLLNRAPTLHRLGFQAFQPKLVDGRAILLHPLVCPAFNADFDGDQMAVHVPISPEARAEAWKLMLSRNNLLSPATGEPLVLPSQDMVLGCYYLTTNATSKGSSFQKGYGLYFDSVNDVLRAYHQGLLSIHAIIWLKWNGPAETHIGSKASQKPLELRVSLYGTSQVLYQKSYLTYQPNKSLVRTVRPYAMKLTAEISQEKEAVKAKTTNLGVELSNVIKTTPGKILFNMIIRQSLHL